MNPMSPNTAYAINQLLLPAAVMLVLVWSLIGAAVGAGLIFSSASMVRIFAVLNRYVSTRHGLRSLSMTHDLGPVVRRHRRAVGVVFILCAAYSAFGLAAWLDRAALVSALGLGYPRDFIAWILESVWWYLILLSVLGMAVGVMLVFFPAILSRIELLANHWYSIRKAALGVDSLHLSLDRLVGAFPRSTGIVILLAAVYVAVNAAILWLKVQ